MMHPLQKEITIVLTEDQLGKRFDKAIADCMGDYSRTDIKRWIQAGHVINVDNGKVLTSPSVKIDAPLTLRMTIPIKKEESLSGTALALDIIYEDEHIVVINKPAGLTVHPGAGVDNATLVHGLIDRYGLEGLASDAGDSRPGILHRLDKETTGLMLVARNNAAYHKLKKDLQKRTIQRTYQALVWGVPSPRSGTIETLYGRHPKNRIKMAVLADGQKNAITNYEITQPLGLHNALVTCHLETGRTHQIRVHLAYIGNPVIGDPLYAPQHIKQKSRLSKETLQAIEKMNRQALHACKLSFKHPETGEIMTFELPLPQDMQIILDLF